MGAENDDADVGIAQILQRNRFAHQEWVIHARRITQHGRKVELIALDVDVGRFGDVRIAAFGSVFVIPQAHIFPDHG